MTMPKSLLEQLPAIVATGRQEAERILEHGHRIMLQTREWVLPAKDSAILKWIKANGRSRRIDAQPDRLIHGNNLSVMAALLTGNDAMPSLRGKIDLIHIDPPFDFKTDAPAELANGIASYLTLIAPRLILMRELLSDNGSIYIHADRHAGHYLKAVMDEIFGRRNLSNEVICRRNVDDASVESKKCMQFASEQKPVPSLEKILLTATDPASIVADFFGGRGDTAAIAERLGRRWITSDMGASACMRMRKRLINQNAEPFLYQEIDEH